MARRSILLDDTSVSFCQLFVGLDKWACPRRFVVFTATSDLQIPVPADTVLSLIAMGTSSWLSSLAASPNTRLLTFGWTASIGSSRIGKMRGGAS